MKEIIKRFNQKPNIEDFKVITNSNYNKCLDCSEPILYSDTRFNSKLNISGKSQHSTKTVGMITYNLCRCEKCVIAKYPEYLTKNSSRIFNTLQDITIYAFNIPSDKVTEYRNNNSNTLDNFIKKYGYNIGNVKWKVYCDKQAYSNSLEYKSEKHGWTEEEFNSYNNSRSITYEKCVERHGSDKGLTIWNNYREKQKVNGSSIEYFQSLYGVEEGTKFWNELSKKKSNNIDSFKQKYGSEKGEIMYKNYIDKISKNINPYSKISQKLFSRLDEYLKDYDLTTYYYTKNKEYGKNIGSRYVYLDYYIEELNLCIEFNGTIYHADPSIYSANDYPLYFDKSILASDLWLKDRTRIKALKDLYNIDTLIVWENELTNKGIENICSELTFQIYTRL